MKFSLTLLSLALLATMSVSAQKSLKSGTPGDVVPGELIVMFHKHVDANYFAQKHSSVDGLKSGLKPIAELSALSHIYLFSFSQDISDSDQILRDLALDPAVEAVQYNHFVEDRATVPNDPSFNSQWHHVEQADHDIDTDLAWDISTGGHTANGDRIVVAVLEGGGSDYSHADLIDNHWVNPLEIAGNGVDDDNNSYVDDVNGWNTASNSDAISAGGHGTSVSGMIGATGNNGTGVVGVNWRVGIMQVQMGGGLTDASVVAAYSYPHTMRNLYNTTNGAQGAFVVATNASWGIDLANPADYPIWCAYYDDLGSVGILNCGATANQQYNIDTQGDMPTGCSSDYMVAVTATNNMDERTFSAYGATTIDLGAPGENVYLPASGDSYGATNGTSFASPCVAGAIALVYSAPCADLAAEALSTPQATADLVRSFIFDGVDPVAQLGPETVTGGRLNAFNAINLAMTNCNPDLGCTDPEACNYSPDATTDNGNCQYNDLCGVCGGDNSSCGGCTDPAACNYEPNVVIDDGSCMVNDVCGVCGGDGTTCSGCTDPLACNYDPAAIEDDGSCIIGGTGVIINILTDDYPGETTWTLTDDALGTTVASGGPYVDLATAHQELVCVGDGCYTFTILDSYGDGVCCAWGVGSYDLTVDGALLIAGGEFAASEASQFCVGEGMGCTDPMACNYDQDAINDNGLCNFDCYGCMDSTACNYDATATQDDGTCIIGGTEVNITVGGGTWQDEISWSLILNGTSVASGGAVTLDLCIDDGCYTLSMEDTYGDGWNGNTYTITDVATGVVIMTGSLDTAANGDGTTTGTDYFAFNSTDCELGCTDSSACNYDATASQDDGSCNFDCTGCMDATACNYDSTATQDDGSCLQNDICGVCGGDGSTCSGCTDPAACNYDATAIQDDGSCIMPDPVFGCDCELVASVVATALEGTFSSVPSEATGAGTLTTVTIDLNWANPLADASYPADMLVQIGTPDGSCIEFGGWDYSSGVCADQGDYSLVYPTTWQTSTAGLYNAVVDLTAAAVSGDGVWSVTIVNGYSISLGADYDATFTLGGICPGEVVEVPGCTDMGACNYDPTANTDDGTCEYTSCSGCVDPMACNYDPAATIDDGLCEMQSCYGCMDSTACNYDSTATFDDGSCEFASCDCPEDINGDGVISVADILELLGQFGCTSGCTVDLNGDDATNVQDILILLAAFGTTC